MKKLIWLLFPILILMVSCQSDGNDLGEESSVTDVLGVEPTIPAKKPTAREEIRDQTPRDSVNVGKFEFANSVYEFGTLKEGATTSHSFRFKNVGKAPLVISSAIGSCGCTVPKHSKEPIPVGGEGEINVSFNSKGKIGKQNKTVTITANTWPERTTLYVRGEVQKK